MKGYRTLAFNAAVALFGFAETVDWTALVGPHAGIAIAGVSLVNMLLRTATTGPVGKAAEGQG